VTSDATSFTTVPDEAVVSCRGITPERTAAARVECERLGIEMVRMAAAFDQVVAEPVIWPAAAVTPPVSLLWCGLLCARRSGRRETRLAR
jgi:hypothetical protein